MSCNNCFLFFMVILVLCPETFGTVIRKAERQDGSVTEFQGCYEGNRTVE